MDFSNPIIASLLITMITIFLDTFFGVLISIKNKEFDITKLPQFIATNLFPYIGGLITIACVAYFIPQFEYLFYAGTAMVAIKFTKEALIDKMMKLFE